MKPAVDRMRDYRARMTETKRKIVQKRNRQQQQASRQKWNIARKKDEAVKAKARMRQMRKRKKEALLVTMNEAIVSPRKVFSSAQALGKAISRVSRVLPKSPRRKAAVVRKLARDFGMEGEKSKVVVKEPTEMENMVKDFYMSDLVSRQLPGKKDCVTVVLNGQKQKVQKRVLVMTVREAHKVFLSEHNSATIGKSKFATLRPQNVLPVSDKDQTVCCCRYHENLQLLLDGLKKCFGEFPNSQQLMEQCSCRWDKECYFGKCTECCNVDMVVDRLLAEKSHIAGTSHMDDSEHQEMEVSYYQWSATNSKELITDRITQVRKELTNQIESVKKHSFLAKVQLQQIRELKAKLSKDEAVMQEDFSENFCIKQQDEIMSAHWVTESVTVFTAVIYQSDGSTSYAVVSDELHHDKYSVFCYNQAILQHYTSQHGKTIKNLHLFSDGAASQFKNRYTLSTIMQPELIHSTIKKMDWSFFATAHGKGPVDGIGGSVKRAVWRRILQKQVVVNSAQDFAAVAKDACPSIDIVFVGKNDVSVCKQQLEAVWQETPPLAIQQTQLMHYAHLCESGDGLEVSDISPFSDTVMPQFRRAHVASKNDSRNSAATASETEALVAPSSSSSVSEHRMHTGTTQHSIVCFKTVH